MYRKTYEVTGYAPVDGGYLLCLNCHDEAFPHHDVECECGAVFLGSETDGREFCDDCFEPIDTTVLREGAA